jgi:pyruvate dehydrogenase E1 component alpha subunit
MESGIAVEDAVITSHRTYGWAYVRGVSVLGVLAELTGTPPNYISFEWNFY